MYDIRILIRYTVGTEAMKKDPKIGQWIGIMILTALVIIVGYAEFILWLSVSVSEISLAKIGVFGDSFGIVTALFSSLAFGGLVIAIWLQRQDLTLQRDELLSTRKDMKDQAFENTFFQMLRLHNEIVNSIDLRTSKGGTAFTSTGRDCFVIFVTRLQGIFIESGGGKHSRYVDEDEIDLLGRVYGRFFEQYQSDIPHYFRYLYSVFKFVDGSSISDKKLYTGIAKAQLSDQELILLFYHCLSPCGNPRFKRLIEKYALLENIQAIRLFHTDHMDFYDRKAFGAHLIIRVDFTEEQWAMSDMLSEQSWLSKQSELYKKK